MRESHWVRTTAASLLVCAVGGALLARGTDGFRALTSEQARRLAVQESPVALPDVELEDQSGRSLRLASQRGRPVVVNFIYTQCRTVCPLMSAGFQRLDRGDTAGLALVSISFDPSDTRDRLRTYASHYNASDDWRFARARDSTRLPAMLKAFGIIVIPDGRGDFQHNAAVHVLDGEGRLARVLDQDASRDEVLAAVRSVRQR